MGDFDSELEHNEAADLRPLNPQAVQDEDDGFDFSEEQLLYNDILQRSCKKVRLVILVSLIAPLMCTTRWYVMQLYMQSLPSSFVDSSTSVISSIIFGGFMLSAVQSFLAAWFGDKHGHDKSLLFVFVMNALGVLLESMATDLWMFTLGSYFTGFALIQITMAYIAFVLPHKHAISYMSVFFSLCSIVYFFGPLFAAVISDTLSYRSVFVLNTVVLCLCVLLVAVFVLGSQRKLQSTQSTLSRRFVEQQDKDDIFPICIHSNNAPGSSSWNAFFEDIGRTELQLLTISAVQNSLAWTVEVVYLFYFAMFFLLRLNVSLLYTSAMFLLLTVTYGAVTLLMPRVIGRMIPTYAWIVPTACLLYMVTLVAMMLGPNDFPVYYWLLIPLQGACFGAVQIGTEMGMLEMQPKQHSGKVAGAKEALKIVLRAFGVLLVGLLWRAPHYNSWAMVNGLCAFLVMILSGFVWMIGNKLK